MPTDPLTGLSRTNINLYASDVAYLQLYYGRGWTNQIREWVHDRIKQRQAAAAEAAQQARLDQLNKRLTETKL